jgi:Domain of unknown function (DUF2828)
MAFVQAMNAPQKTKIGVNGETVYTAAGVGDSRVALFTMLNRGLAPEKLQDAIRTMFEDSKTLVKPQMQLDMFLMAFQTRDIRGGKGEKQLFYHFMKALYEHDPLITTNVVRHIPEYGCWRDMWELMKEVPELTNEVLKVTRDTFLTDRLHLKAGSTGKMSLLAKWLPREGSAYAGAAKKIAAFLYPNITNGNKRMMTYRTDVSEMNKALKTVEINMCSGTWQMIEPDCVPGRCLKIHSKAFYNLQKKDGVESFRYPDSEDRMECRNHFLDWKEELKAGTKKAKGADVVMPHELVSQTLERSRSADEQDITQAQWDSIREKMAAGGGLGKAVPMCDFSGSMDGLPKLISLALGILISEVTHPTFKDHILSFDSTPTWHSFAGRPTLKDKIASISHNLGHGLSTDFYKACMCILDRMVQHRVPVGEEPEDLIVLTDMGFDEASMIRSTNRYHSQSQPYQLEAIRTAFKEAGEKVWGKGKGWKPPRIVIWNLRAEYDDFHAKADQEGVVQLSGWSPNVLKVLEKGRMEVQTPYETMREILDDERYGKIADVWFFTPR